MSEDWKMAYEAGIFTEFLEQRAPGHTVLDDKIYSKGMLDFKKEIRKAKQALQHPHWYKKYNPFTFIYHEVDHKFFPLALDYYEKALRWALARKKLTILGALGFLVLVFIAFGLIPIPQT
jgi:hypothetical protein